jgi:hypothetical protein
MAKKEKSAASSAGHQGEGKKRRRKKGVRLTPYHHLSFPPASLSPFLASI